MKTAEILLVIGLVLVIFFMQFIFRRGTKIGSKYWNTWLPPILSFVLLCILSYRIIASPSSSGFRPVTGFAFLILAGYVIYTIVIWVKQRKSND